jgi:hypothetical protein
MLNRAGLRNHHVHRTGVAMANRSAEDPRLTRLTEAALALPGATRKMGGSHAQFLVRKRTFAYFLSNHHDDSYRGSGRRVAESMRQFGAAREAADRIEMLVRVIIVRPNNPARSSSRLVQQADGELFLRARS